jgi:large subunit ribosomal protein L18e
MKRLRVTNPQLVALIRDLKKKSQESQTEIWCKIAKRLANSKRSRIAVNVSHLNRYTKDGDTVVVPGKVLGSGKADHPIIVAAFAFSDVAESKIKKAKGNCLSIQDLMKKNPTAKNVKFMG